jgi:hypothetical protein
MKKLILPEAPAGTTSAGWRVPANTAGALLLLLLANSTNADPMAGAIDAFGSRLKSQLQQGISLGGPVAAISICQEMAPVIAREVEAETGVSVRRVTDRPRNPLNAASPDERLLIDALAAQLGDGVAPAASAVREVMNGQEVLARPIIVGAVCLACHGTSLAADVAAALAERYPQDRATGYAEGDLRGAFIAVTGAAEN